jgi:NAD(P)-dependent dehydrogenase (short-subunit alcohol dehydrogenase family)
MNTLEGKKVLVTGGSRGLGLGIVEALVAQKANVTVLSRDAGRLAEVEHRLGVATIAGDIRDRALATSALRDVRPDILILNAGATPKMGPLHELAWEDFSVTWETDVKAGLHWMQEAIRLPLAAGSRVLIGSSGAAINGSPLSGGYAGAQRMLWLMGHYANGLSAELGLGIRFQVLVPRQMIGEGGVGRAGAAAYARKKGISEEEFLKSFGKPMPPRAYGDHVAELLTNSCFDTGTAFSFRGDTGIQPLDGPA